MLGVQVLHPGGRWKLMRSFKIEWWSWWDGCNTIKRVSYTLGVIITSRRTCSTQSKHCAHTNDMISSVCNNLSVAVAVFPVL